MDASNFNPGSAVRSSLVARLFSRVAHCATGILILLAASGCYSPRKKVAQNMHDLQFQWQTNVIHQIALPEQTLNWPQALEELEGNLKLRRGRADITNAQGNVKQVYRDLLPTLNLRSGLSIFYFKTQLLNAAGQLSGQSGGIAALEIIFAQFVIGPAFEM